MSLTNVELPGLGVPIRYDATTGTGAAIRVSGLCANEAYVFAIGAFDAAGRPLGPIGPTGPEIDALVPLPLPLCFALVAREAVALGVERTGTFVSESVSCVTSLKNASKQAAVGKLCEICETYEICEMSHVRSPASPPLPSPSPHTTSLSAEGWS